MIEKELKFIGFLDFCTKREQIKEKYLELDLQNKKIYKLYVYSMPFEQEYVKDILWEYLNSKEDCIFYVCKMMAEIERRKRLNLNRHRKECDINVN